MMKCSLLIAFLLVGIYSQDVATFSSINNTEFVSAALDLTLITKYAIKDPPVPFADKAGNLGTTYAPNGDATWVFTDGKKTVARPQQIFPRGWSVKYKFCICSYCPTLSTAVVNIFSSGFYVLTNSANTVISSGWAWSGVSVTVSGLKCGCGNVFYLTIINFFGSPLGVLYNVVVPSQTSCWTCSTTSVTVYNPKTCMCECANKCACVGKQSWFDYPKCICQCQNPVSCLQKNQYYDTRACACVCLPRCCLPWQVQSPTTCGCVSKIAASLS